MQHSPFLGMIGLKLTVVKNPVRKILDIFRDNGIPSPFSNPWGRSFRSASGTASPGTCTNVQFHARVGKDCLTALLQRSGFNKVYITPKTRSHDLLPGYAIVWLNMNQDEARVQALKAPGQCGLVRSRDRLGGRVLEANFVQAHESLKPGQAVPPRLEIRHSYRLLGVPPGLRAEDIQQWGDQVAWPVKPLRPAGPTQWVIGSAVPPPSGLHSINASPILIQEVAPRRVGQAVLSAGRLPPPVLPSDAKGVDPLSINDPWSQYKQARGEPVSAPTEQKGPLPRSSSSLTPAWSSWKPQRRNCGRTRMRPGLISIA